VEYLLNISDVGGCKLSKRKKTITSCSNGGLKKKNMVIKHHQHLADLKGGGFRDGWRRKVLFAFASSAIARRAVVNLWHQQKGSHLIFS
jgi:hypothetical protein